MAREPWFGSLLTIDPHELLRQQGRVWTGYHRSEDLANNATQQYLFDVQSLMHANMSIAVGGDCFVDMSTVTSYIVGAGSSLGVWNRNTLFTGINSFGTKLFRSTSIQAGSLALWKNFIPGGTRQFADGAKDELKEFILGPGIYQLEITNKSAATTNIALLINWEEPENIVENS